MYIPKRYGQSQTNNCPFCGKQATTENKQGFPVCRLHHAAVMDDFKCLCGDTLDIMKGKFGIFFKCIRCGTMNLRKAMEINTVRDISEDRPTRPPLFKTQEPTGNITKKRHVPGEMEPVRSDDPRYFD
ncbi:MAG: hypothetical protein V1729_03030 [Candidatus Woesearchaeota archaeon]